MKNLLVSLCLLACLPMPAGAQSRPHAHASAWVSAAGAQLRLIAHPVTQADPATWQTGGLEVRLEPGAKTYWRSPGDTGVPPTVDFAASEGLSDITLDFPAPVGYDDGAGGMAIGYRESLIFPIRYKIAKPPEPVASGGFFSRKVEQKPPVRPKLALTIDFGVCVRNMCIPGQAKADLPIGGGTLESGLGDRLVAAQTRVPVRKKVGAEGPIGISSVQVRRQADGAEIEIGARLGPNAGSAGLFIEAKDTLIATQQGAPIGGAVVFRSKARSGPGDKLGEARITLATASGAIDVTVDLDAATRRP